MSSDVDYAELRHRVTLTQSTPAQSGLGGARSRSTFATVWARITPLGAHEQSAAGDERARVTHEITIRYLDGVTPEMRVEWEGRSFAIHGITRPDEIRRWLVLSCMEGE